MKAIEHLQIKNLELIFNDTNLVFHFISSESNSNNILICVFVAHIFNKNLQSNVIKCPNKLLEEIRFNFNFSKSDRHTLVYLYSALRKTFLIRYAVSPPKSILSLGTIESRDMRLFKEREKEERERKANGRNWIPLMAVRIGDLGYLKVCGIRIRSGEPNRGRH